MLQREHLSDQVFVPLKLIRRGQRAEFAIQWHHVSLVWPELDLVRLDVLNNRGAKFRTLKTG